MERNLPTTATHSSLRQGAHLRDSTESVRFHRLGCFRVSVGGLSDVGRVISLPGSRFWVVLDGWGRISRGRGMGRGLPVADRRHGRDPGCLWFGNYPGLSRAATRRKRSCPGQADDRWKPNRRVLRVIKAPIFRSLRRRVAHCARAIRIPWRPHRRIASSRVQAEPVGEELALLFPDAVFHLATGTVQIFAERPAVAFQAGHHEARIGTPGVVPRSARSPGASGPGCAPRSRDRRSGAASAHSRQSPPRAPPRQRAGDCGPHAWRSKSVPPSLVTNPPSKPASTRRPQQAGNESRSGIRSVIAVLLCQILFNQLNHDTKPSTAVPHS